MRNKSWQKFEDLICEYIKEIDPYARPTKGSGNKGEKADIKTSCPLALELKERNTKSPYDENWLIKCSEEIPLHSSKIPVVVTRNKDGEIRVHLKWEDFWELFKRSLEK